MIGHSLKKAHWRNNLYYFFRKFVRHEVDSGRNWLFFNLSTVDFDKVLPKNG